MVRTEILDEALKGGEPARTLLENATRRRLAAQQTLAERASSNAGYASETRKRMSELQDEWRSLEQELDMMKESLDDLRETSMDISRKSREAKTRVRVLGALEVAMGPVIEVADALQASENMQFLSIEELQNTSKRLTWTLDACRTSQLPVLKQALEVLEERLSSVTGFMKNRFIDLVNVSDRMVVVEEAKGSRPRIKAAADALYEANLMDKALRGIISKFRENDVALELRKAVVFRSVETEKGRGWEWMGARGYSTNDELLEFDLDDLEEVDENTIDMMTIAPDMPNAAARVLKIFDLLRNNLVGPEHSALLASAMQNWISSEVLPPSAVLLSDDARGKEDRASQSASADSLRNRVRALTAAASVLQSAFLLRGASGSFKISVDTSVTESKVGAECRAQVLLKARRAIGEFSLARHSTEAFVPCPISSQNIPESSRGPDWFPYCIVTQAAVTVMVVFKQACVDARDALNAGSKPMSDALASAAREAVEAYGEDIPLQHSDELRGSLRLKVLFYNDCMMLGHFCQRFMETQVVSALSYQIRQAITEAGADLQSTARNVLAATVNAAHHALLENMDSACRNRNLCAYGTISRIQRGKALSAACNVIRELISAFSVLMPAEIGISAAAEICMLYLNRFCDEILELEEIGEHECRILNDILADAIGNSSSFMTMAQNEVTAKGQEMTSAVRSKVSALNTAQRRVAAFREILDSRMADIVAAFRARQYEGLVSREAIERLIRAIFEDSHHRQVSLRELDQAADERAAGAVNSIGADEWNAEW